MGRDFKDSLTGQVITSNYNLDLTASLVVRLEYRGELHRQ